MRIRSGEMGRELERGLRRGDRGRTVPGFTGIEYATIPAWTPKSALAEVRVDFTPSALPGNQFLCGGDPNPQDFGIYLTASGEVKATLRDAAAVVRTVASGGANLAVVGERTQAVFRLYPGKIELFFGGVVASVAGDFSAISNLLVDQVASANNGSAPFNGTLHRCEFIDLSPLQNVRAMAAVSRSAPIPTLAFTGDFKIRVRFICPDFASQRCMFGGLSGAVGNYAAVNVSGKLVMRFGTYRDDQGAALVAGRHYVAEFFRVGGQSYATLNGVQVLSPLADTSTVVISRIASFYDGNQTFESYEQVEITDLTTGKVWKYNNANDSGNLLVNSNPATAEGEEAQLNLASSTKIPTGTSTVTTNSDGSIRVFAPDDNYAAITFSSILDSGATTQVDIRARIDAGSFVLGSSSGDVLPINLGGGWYRVTSRLGASNLEIKRPGGSGPDDFTVYEVVLREITHGLWHQSGTAMTPEEGEAARGWLPPISDVYLCDEPGKIKSLLRGPTYDAVITGDLQWVVPGK